MSLASLKRLVPEAAYHAVWTAAHRAGIPPSGQCPMCGQPVVQADIPATVEPRILVCMPCQHVFLDNHAIDWLKQFTGIEARTPEDAYDARRELAMVSAQMVAEKHQRQVAQTADGPDKVWKIFPMLLGLPVKANTPELSIVPWATWGLAAILALVALPTLGGIRAIAAEWGCIPADPLKHGGLNLLTSALLHGNILHLAGNLYYLLLFAPEIEDAMGRVWFGVLIVTGALCGSLLYCVAAPGSLVPAIGASGFVYTLMVFFALQFHNVKLAWPLHWCGMCAPMRALMPIWLMIVIRVMIDALALCAGAPGIAHGAHLGGAAAGLAVWLVWRRRAAQKAGAVNA